MATPVSSTVLKAFEVIDLFTRHQVLSVPQCADQLDIPRSTAYRLLATLREAGVVETTSSGNFRLGFRLFQIGSTAPLRLDLIDRARAPLQQLTTETGLTAELAVRSGRHILHLERVPGRHTIAADHAGVDDALHAAAAGKVLLAATDPDAVDELLGDDLPAHTDATIVDRAALLAELEQVALRGWADDRGECVPGSWGVAVGVRDGTGRVIAAIGVTGPADAVHRHHLRLRRLLGGAVRLVERRGPTGWDADRVAPPLAGGPAAVQAGAG